MFWNYLKIARRHLVKHSVFAFINVLGLGLGMACCLFIYLFVRHELSYDDFHPKKDQLYRIVYHANNDYDFAQVPPPLAPLVQSNLSGVEATARAYRRSLSVSIPDPTGMGNVQDYEEENVFMVDSTFFRLFELEFLAGNANEDLSQAQKAIINEELAAKYFGEQWQYNSPIGQTIMLEGVHPYQIAAVVRDFPENSHLSFNILLPYEDMFALMDDERREGMRENLANNWVISHSHSYVLLKEGVNPAEVDKGMEQLLQTYAPEPLRVGQSFTLQAVPDIYLNPDVYLNPGPVSDISYIYTFVGIALITLLIACFNFINLATAQSLKRSKEVGMRKVLGARKLQLFLQFLGESLLISFLALLLAVLIISVTLPEFNNITQKSFTFADLLNGPVLLAFLGIFFLTGILGGSYPAFYTTNIKLALILKNKAPLRKGWANLSLRQALVLVQFTMSIALIAGTVIIFQQLNFLQSRPLGFVKEAMITVPLYSDNLNNVFGAGDANMRQRMNTFEESLLQNASIEAVTLSSGVLGLSVVSRRTEPEGVETEGRLFIPTMAVDYDFSETYGLEIVAGRDFDIAAGSDHIDAFMINESAVRNFNWGTSEEALGKEIELEGKVGYVIGVVKDFHYTSLHSPIGSLVMGVSVPLFNTFSIRAQGSNLNETLAFVEQQWKEFFPHKAFEYDFLDEQLRQAYQTEDRVGNIIGIFALLAIFVSCLGSYGLALLLAKQKEKEISIRKVLGANIAHIVSMLTKGYFVLILIASILAVPLAYWGMNRWLENFAYRTDMNWWLFGIAIFLVLIIATFTISFQTIKAAIANPVNALKDE
ncbi:ABC transporter permease [Catalinimonas niigatensis]|uniref:ABC transporter permease n=1 Tax=Catalinimonas niigatensis TaxID=1397264 RepID=UPI00266538E5|nr:ABC transporter permease [Catalinimonas niigatensis]WPP48386.1 ABC transporter permease [Catalinimonas niigatensis]